MYTGEATLYTRGIQQHQASVQATEPTNELYGYALTLYCTALLYPLYIGGIDPIYKGIQHAEQHGVLTHSHTNALAVAQYSTFCTLCIQGI